MGRQRGNMVRNEKLRVMVAATELLDTVIDVPTAVPIIHLPSLHRQIVTGELQQYAEAHIIRCSSPLVSDVDSPATLASVSGGTLALAAPKPKRTFE